MWKIFGCPGQSLQKLGQKLKWFDLWQKGDSHPTNVKYLLRFFRIRNLCFCSKKEGRRKWERKNIFSSISSRMKEKFVFNLFIPFINMNMWNLCLHSHMWDFFGIFFHINMYYIHQIIFNLNIEMEISLGIFSLWMQSTHKSAFEAMVIRFSYRSDWILLVGVF